MNSLSRPLEDLKLRNDLELTVRELSNTYEEISLLYKISYTLAGLSLDEIYEKILDLAEDNLGYKNSAIYLVSEDKESFILKRSKGGWPHEISEREINIFRDAINKNRTLAYCNYGMIREDLIDTSMLVSPLKGKKRDIGIFAVLEPQKREFLSHELKLINAITSQTALFIENSLLYQEFEELVLGSIQCLINALEATSSWTAGHTERVMRYSLAIAYELRLPFEEIEEIRLASLLHDIGKIGISQTVLDKPSKLDEYEIDEIKSHPGKAEEILKPLKPCTRIIEIIKYHHERWDGNGFYGLKGDEIPLASRIIAVSDAFDAMMSDRPYRKRLSKEEAIHEININSGIQFDPMVVDAFLRIADTL